MKTLIWISFSLLFSSPRAFAESGTVGFAVRPEDLETFRNAALQSPELKADERLRKAAAREVSSGSSSNPLLTRKLRGQAQAVDGVPQGPTGNEGGGVPESSDQFKGVRRLR